MTAGLRNEGTERARNVLIEEVRVLVAQSAGDPKLWTRTGRLDLVEVADRFAVRACVTRDLPPVLLGIAKHWAHDQKKVSFTFRRLLRSSQEEVAAITRPEVAVLHAETNV